MSEEQGVAQIFIGGEPVTEAEYWLSVPEQRRQPQLGILSIADRGLAQRLFDEDRPVVLKRKGKPDVEIIIEDRGTRSDQLSFRVGRHLL